MSINTTKARQLAGAAQRGDQRALGSLLQSFIDLLADEPISATADLSLRADLHGGKTIIANKADGIAFTLPAATGSGAKYRIVVGTAITSNNLTVVVTGDDVFTGHVLADDGDGEPANGFPTAANTNRITMGGTGNATGGVKGDIIELQDIAADTWSVRITGVQGGTEATPFSNV